MVLISSWLIWSISWKYPRLCNDLGNIKVLFNAMTLELFHRIHCGAMQYSFENKIHFVLVTFNGRVVFRSIGCLRSETTWVRKIRSEKQRERSLAAWGLLPPLPKCSEYVWRSCNSPVRLGLSLANMDHVTCCLVPDWLPVNNLWIVPLPSANCVANLIPLAV